MSRIRWQKGALLVALVGLNLGALFAAGNLPLNGTKDVSAPFLERAAGETALVFFGFPGCSSSCPVTLQRLSAAYPRLRQLAPDLEVFFVNLQPVAESGRTRAYVHAHDARFKGVAPAGEELARLQREFGAWLYRNGKDREPFHNPYVYLLAHAQGGWQIRARVPADGEVVAGILRALKAPLSG